MRAVNLEKMLPADIPPGERVLWFGRPEPVSLWRHAYRADLVGVWFLAMTVWNVASGSASDGVLGGFVSALRALGFGAGGMAILALLAWASARTTLYVVTERRIVIKTGIALPIFINVPFKQIAGANLRAYADGSGEVTVALTDKQRIPYLALWPSARPFHFGRPEPALRSIPGARDVAAILGRALAEAANQPAMAPVRAHETADAPAGAAAAVA